MRVLLVDNYDSFTYNLAQLLDESKLCSFVIKKNDKIDFQNINNYDKILLSPGAGIPSEAGQMMQVIKEFYDKKPIFGVCLGMQAIAEFFGGSLLNLNTVYHGKKIEINVDNSDPIFAGFNKNIDVGLYHSWAVQKENLPAILKITAISKQNIIMAISHKYYDVKGVQFHPESYMTKDGKAILTNWLKAI
ncbi:MAG: aminodeoxychorismate/anthranilate synthase component II [Bacteroidales bacterium]|nr:aminodeoxychorismate/anthranilate synthase component II [Bacteroidales bacterium]